jgi:BlaR1 peptidase M56
VLLASVAMPALMQWSAFSIPAPLPKVLPAVPPIVPSIAFAIGPVEAAQARASINWQGVLGSCYLAGAALLLLRLLTGVTLTWKLRRDARPTPAEWEIPGDVRQSEAIAAPATFGSTILLPAESTDWPPAMRQAVLAHERSHVEHGDFYVHLLANLYRAAFWFNPLAWYLRNRLSELAEARSDDAAIAIFPDRPSYAEILLGFVKKAQGMSFAVGMARPATVTRRVERILAETRLTKAMSRKTRTFLIASMVPVIALAAGCSIRSRVRAQAAAPQPAPALVADSATVEGDRISFDHDRKPYYVDDPATVVAAKQLFREQEELGRQQAELGKVQAQLGESQAQVAARPPDISAELDSLRMQMELLREQFKGSADLKFRQEDFGDLQSLAGDLQAKVGEVQNQISNAQARLGDAQAALGEQQAQIGERQAILGDQQIRASQEAMERLHLLLDEALRKGLARPVQ